MIKTCAPCSKLWPSDRRDNCFLTAQTFKRRLTSVRGQARGGRTCCGDHSCREPPGLDRSCHGYNAYCQAITTYTSARTTPKNDFSRWRTSARLSFFWLECVGFATCLQFSRPGGLDVDVWPVGDSHVCSHQLSRHAAPTSTTQQRQTRPSANSPTTAGDHRDSQQLLS